MKHYNVKISGVLAQLNDDDGARKQPLLNGHRADVLFEDSVRYCVVGLLDESRIAPGESCSATLQLLLHGKDEIEVVRQLQKLSLREGRYEIAVLENPVVEKIEEIAD